MTRPTILVTGATGKTGGAVATQLRQQGWPVRAVVRTRDARSDRLDRLGVETVAADPFDPDQLAEAIRGTKRAYYLPINHPYMIQAASAFAVAARGSGLESIVQMSQWLSSPAHPSLMTRQTWLVDHLFAMIPGVAHTIINPGMFADNYLRVVDFASLLGIYPVLAGKSRSAPVANEDIARVAVAALVDPDRHAGQSYRPTGPKLLSGSDMAAILGRVLGRRVRPIEMPFGMFLRVARMQGVDPYLLSGFRSYLQDHRLGAFEVGGGTNDVVREVTGTPAEDFEATARRYAALPFARPTFANRVRAIVNFLRVPFHPGYNLDRRDRQQNYPVPPQPRFSVDDDRWRVEHAPETTRGPIQPLLQSGLVA